MVSSFLLRPRGVRLVPGGTASDHQSDVGGRRPEFGVLTKIPSWHHVSWSRSITSQDWYFCKFSLTRTSMMLQYRQKQHSSTTCLPHMDVIDSRVFLHRVHIHAKRGMFLDSRLSGPRNMYARSLERHLLAFKLRTASVIRCSLVGRSTVFTKPHIVMVKLLSSRHYCHSVFKSGKP